LRKPRVKLPSVAPGRKPSETRKSSERIEPRELGEKAMGALELCDDARRPALREAEDGPLMHSKQGAVPMGLQ